MIALALLVVIQLVYPRDRTVPFAALGNDRVGFMLSEDIQTRLDKKFEAAKLTVKTPAKTIKKPLSSIGVSSQTEISAKQVVDYPLWLRFVPASLFWHRPVVDKFTTKIDKEAILQTSTELAANLSTKPVDAGLAVADGDLVFTSAKAGYTLDPTSAEKSLRQQSFSLHSTVMAPKVTKVQPTYTDADFAMVRTQAEKAIAKPITFTASQERTFAADKPTIASWLAVQKSEDHKVSLAVNADAVNGFLVEINKQIGVVPKPTQIQLRDGVETGRQTGTVGSAVNETDAIGKVTAIVDGANDRTVAVVMKPVPPPSAYNRSYSSSQAGLQAYVDYITTSQDAHIALQQLDGHGWTANGRAGDSVVSASTYKLYVAMMLFSRIESGQTKWDDSMQGTTVRTCFDQMIVQSLNNCSEAWLDQFGRSKLNAFLYERGLSHATTFTAKDASQTSASDLLKTLIGLHNGTLYKGSNRDILLADMARQVHRNGVPAGSSGSVQDKVGFLWDYNHDAAIVRTAKGSYAVAIMTKGKSFDEVATITRQLEAIMYP